MTGDLCFINEYLGVQSKIFTQPLNISKHHVFKWVDFPFGLSVEAISKQGQGFKIDANYEMNFREMGRGKIFRTFGGIIVLESFGEVIQSEIKHVCWWGQ